MTLVKKIHFRIIFLGRRKRHRKHLQMFIPAFLAVNAVGWMLFAVLAVKVLTFKALIVSKIAFILSAAMTAKKMMETETQKYF